jgi:hypothetical protein
MLLNSDLHQRGISSPCCIEHAMQGPLSSMNDARVEMELPVRIIGALTY